MRETFERENGRITAEEHQTLFVRTGKDTHTHTHTHTHKAESGRRFETDTTQRPSRAARFQRRRRADLAEVGDAEDEADGVEDVALAAAVEAGDGIEEGVKARHHRALLVRLEAVDNHLLRSGGRDVCVSVCVCVMDVWQRHTQRGRERSV